jgi:RNA polymerase sigma-70 factor (ECF subfamily)
MGTEPADEAAPAQAGAASDAAPTAEALVDRYGSMVYHLSLRLTGNPRDAEDLAQDALVRAIRALGSFRGQADPGTWLYRITVNTWKNRVRSEKRRKFWSIFSLDREDESGEKPALEVPDQEPPLEAGLEKDERARAIEAAMSSLAPEDRAILTLREVDGRSYADIASAFDIPVGTVKSRISRARQDLRERLKAYLHGP